MRSQTMQFNNGIYVQSSASVVGPKEAEGPLKGCFDKSYDNLYCGEATWELAERKLMSEAIELCLQKANKKNEEIDFFLGGDLLNQNITASYVAREKEIPFFGLFNACSTSMEALTLASVLLDGGFAEHVVTAVSSHFATAERQFRYPTEFGGQKPSTAMYTVTGSGAAYVSKKKSKIRVESATVGKVVDLGVTSPFNMGAAMAPAAVQTIKTHLQDLRRKPEDYDAIVTGDLSRVGTPILKSLLFEEGIDIYNNHHDCGILIYSADQKVFSGGSGCACSAVVTFSRLFDELKKGELRRIFVVATGALLNPLMIQQNESIPCIAHGVSFQYEDDYSNR
ncbi:stage V sporulation protein AD [Anaerobacillus arseniciselenatis]|uniref:Stage V sporulation protein AD n=1 Tax=Anaerobacillus arseniciselenatis TaxID=85682 RepID=A0A1S2LUQ8_9BACI|nr:stage V sporulation protein AD [Anaerobacillus arseniciselenatis]OIJ15930.1 stage V sporulation protein AD [Anaerobacillus arseniciselenatis]